MHSGELTKYLAFGFVGISILVMGYILYELEVTKRHFAEQIIDQSSVQVQTELDQFFMPVDQLLRSLEQQSSLGLFNNMDRSDLNRYFIPLIERYPQLSSVGLADTTGYELNILPNPEGATWLTREVSVDAWGEIEQWREWKSEASIPEIESWEEPLAMDPRDRPWYQGAMEQQEGELFWTEPYRFVTNQELGVTAAIRWASATNAGPDALLALDLTLRDITRFSQALSITDNNQIFILTRDSREIIGLPAEPDFITDESDPELLLSTPEEFGSPALLSLTSGEVGEMVSLDLDGETWWGLLQGYSIFSSQELLYAILIPESDFATEIHRTQSAALVGFLIILALTLTLVRSHNSLDRARNSLNEKNDVIIRQKERLFAEVHHRVKNNLAVMSALMDLEQSVNTSPEAREVLAKTQRRIKSMAAVHEIMYQSDDLNRVRLSEFLPGILSFVQKDLETEEVAIEHDIDEILININQALTYSLLINELMSSLFRTGLPSGTCTRVQVQREGAVMQTDLHVLCAWDPDLLTGDKGSQLIRVLVQQLNGRMDRIQGAEGYLLSIVFELTDKRGVAGNMSSSQL
ncbi:MAG: sensor histidine kinase [Bacteroidota bacterium]